MTTKYVDVCDFCGKEEVKEKEYDSTGLIITKGEFCFVFPDTSLCLDGHYCPKCLLEVIGRWMKGQEAVEFDSVKEVNVRISDE